MPDFEYKLKNGKTLVLKGDTQPDDSEVESIAAERGLELLPSGMESAINTTDPVADAKQFLAKTPSVETKPTAPDNSGILDQIYNTVFNAPEMIMKPARKLANYLSEPSLPVETSDPVEKLMQEREQYFGGFNAGATEGVASQLSPANLLTLGRGRLPQIAARIIGGIQGGHGVEEIYHGNTWEGLGDIGMGALMGLAPGLHAPEAPPSSILDDAGKIKPDIFTELPHLKIGHRPELDNILRNSPYGEGSIIPSEVTPSELRAPSDDIKYPAVNIREDVIPPAVTDRPDLVPVGAEGVYNSIRQSPDKLAGLSDEAIYGLAQEKFNMGKLFDPAELKLEPKSEFDLRRQAIIDDTARMESERLNRSRNIEEETSNENWNRRSRNMALREGRNINDIKTPLTPEQQQISASYKRIEAEKDKFAQWFSEQENQLPEGELFKPPPEIESAHQSKIREMDKAHDALVNKLTEGYEKDPLPVIDIKSEQPSIFDDVNKLADSPTRRNLSLGTSGDLPPNFPKRSPSGRGGGGGNEPPIQPQSINAEPIIRKMKIKEPKQASAIREAWNVTRGLMSVDLPFITSAGLRQGLPLIGTKNWIKAWAPSIKAYGSKAAFEAHKALMAADPLTQIRTVKMIGKDGQQLMKNGRPVFKEIPSILREAGVELAEMGSLNGREEAIRSQLAERIPVWGKVVASSNRAYVAYINDLRLNTFRNLYDAMPNKNDVTHLKELGDFVSTATGRGPLKVKLPFSHEVASKRSSTGKITKPYEINLEKYAQQASEIIFAPKLIAARMQMMNPMNYVTTAPQVRQEYLKALARTAGAWVTMASIGKIAGAEVSLNPTSADFGKMRFGNLRLDPAGGFQQFLVLMARLKEGETTSSTGETPKSQELMGIPFDWHEGKTSKFGKGFKPETAGSTVQNFVANKLHPSAKAFYDYGFKTPDRPFRVFDKAAELAAPMLTADMIQIAQEEPELFPFLAPLISAGMGAQTYERGSIGKPKFVPEEMDIIRR